MKKNKTRIQPLFQAIGCWLFGVAVLYIDSITARGFADWVLYIIPTTYISYVAPRSLALVSVSLFTVFIAIGAYLSPSGGMPAGMLVLNRSSSVGVMWFLFFVVATLREKKSAAVHAATAMRENESRLQAMFDNAAIGIVEVDTDFRIIMANRRWCHIIGYTPQELIGKAIIDLTLPEDRQHTGDLHDKLVKGQLNLADYDKRYIRKDGVAIWAHVTVSPIRDRNECMRSYIGTVEDITSQKQAQDALRLSEKHYRNLFESMEEGFALCEMIYDETEKPVDYRYLEVNAAFTRLSGLEARKIIGQKATEVIVGLEPFWIETYGRVVRTGHSEHVINPVLALGRYFEVFAWHTDDLRFAAVYKDVTSRVLMESELRHRAEELQLAVTEVESFSYSIAHDLRSPVRAIVSFAQLLESEYGGHLDDKGKDYLDRIKKAGRSIGSRMEELLDYSQIRNVPMKRSPVDLSAIATEITQTLAKAAPGRKVDWRIESGLTTVGDPVLLRQMLYHLLCNAWKFTSKKETAVISFGQMKIHGDKTCFVRDNGAGFNMAFYARLFQPFSRLHTVEEFEGSGIGLAVVKRILERHRGKIWAEAAVNGGATFYFSVPPVEEQTLSLMGARHSE